MNKGVIETLDAVEVSEANLNAVMGISVIDESLLESAAGGHPGSEGHGWFPSVSGECFFGISCNPVYWYR